MRLYGNFQGYDVLGDQTLDPTTGLFSQFMNSGDPLTNTGWRQELYFKPCEVYFMHGSGTFSMAPLDTQRVVYALIIGQADSRLTSIMDLKKNTHFIRDAFLSEFAVSATANAEVNYLSATETEVRITAQVTGERDATSVQGEFYNYSNSLIHTLDLFDDGHHDDGAANDHIFGNRWKTTASPAALYLNLKIIDSAMRTHSFRHAVENITLIADKLTIPLLQVAADHINSDGKLNPGENARLTFHVANNFPFDLNILNVLINTNDPYTRIEPQHFFFHDIAAGTSKALAYNLDSTNSYFVVNLASDAPDTHTIFFDVTFIDDQHRCWREANYVKLKTEPLKYIPNQIIPTHVAGYSDARFVVSVIDPVALTGHNYIITVSDSINSSSKQGFNLVDQTLERTLLKNQAAPDRYAHNIPVTDGFKIIEAYLPEGRLIGSYEQSPGGYSYYPFNSISKAVSYGMAADGAFCPIEIEFTNTIDTSGVVGAPVGQGAFQYTSFPSNGPKGFYPCAFQIYRLENGQRMGRLNACFQEFTSAFPTYDLTWTPGEFLYIMSTEYDATGQYYLNPNIHPENDVLYVVKFFLFSKASIVDAGDRCFIDREFRATKEDVWTFIPTNVAGRKDAIPGTFALYQNYPNPFNPITTLRFSLDKPGRISLTIYNILGQEIMELLDKELATGIHSVQWDGENAAGQYVSSGLYFARLTNRNQTKLIKMLLVR